MSATPHPLGLLAIFRDEAHWLPEWLEYYKLLGVSRFYLYNNLSTDNYLEVLSPYIAQGDVELFDWPHESSTSPEWDAVQVAAYKHGLKHARNQVQWLILVDVDEFIVPHPDKGDSLVTFLDEWTDSPGIGGVCIPWVYFGTSFFKEIPPDKLMIETLLLNSGIVKGGDGQGEYPWTIRGYKSIVRPDKVKDIPDPHYATYRRGYHHVGLTSDYAQVNHYWTRDETYFKEKKIPRRQLWGYNPESTQAHADTMRLLTIFGTRILRFVPRLHRKLKAN